MPRASDGPILRSFTNHDFLLYRQKMRRCMAAFARMLDSPLFADDKPMTGIELEICLVDADYQPAMRNAQILSLVDNPVFQEEIGQFNIEVNVPPRLIGGDGLARYEEYLRWALNEAEMKANALGGGLVLIGILPTVTTSHAVLENVSSNPRYGYLNQQIVAARGGELSIDIHGLEERLQHQMGSIMPEAANTSIQLHIQVTPSTFAQYWNASQAISAIQVAVGANSPFLFGRRLWDETRIALFEQATDTRTSELKKDEMPRVWFGEKWISSIFDLFEENVRYFPTLLPICDDEEPDDVLASGGVPRLSELRLHNGTVYRWNRPVYDVNPFGTPHLRVENRVLSAGPTVVDMLANAAFYFGLTRALAEAERPVWSELPYAAAEHNFFVASREGMSATLHWPPDGETRVAELVLERLLPLAHAGLDRYGVDPGLRDRLLGVIEQRCRTGRNGAVWQSEMVGRLELRGLDRPAALREMLRQYIAHMHTNEPVHTWPVD